MHFTTQGFVLRKVSYSGSSVIATIYTRRFGVMAFMVRGVGAKGRGTSPGALEPLSQVEVVFPYREKNQVQTATSLALAERQQDTGLAPAVSAPILLFLSEMLFKSLREESPDEELFDFLEDAFTLFGNAQYVRDFHLIFLMQLTRFLGFFPEMGDERNAPYFDLQNGTFAAKAHHNLHTLGTEESASFARLASAKFGDKLSLTNLQRRSLLYRMVEYYQLHLEGMGEIKSLPILIEIFAN